MTEPSTHESAPVATSKPSSSPKIWKPAVGVVLIVAGLGWLWTESRQHLIGGLEPTRDQIVHRSSDEDAGPLRTRFHADDTQLSDEEYVAAALAEDRALRRAHEMSRRAERIYRNPVDPHVEWQQRIEKLEEDVARFESFPKGSIQWHLRQRLEEMREEAPEVQ